MNQKIKLVLVIMVLGIMACGSVTAQPTQVVLQALANTQCPNTVCPTCAVSTPEALVITGTPTTKTSGTPTGTVTPTGQITGTQGIVPTEITPTKTISPTTVVTATPTATIKPSIVVPPKPYLVQADPASMKNVIYPDKGCNWMGVVGQAFGKDGKTVRGIAIAVTGTINGKPVELLGVTGVAGGYKVPDAYEIKISDQAFDSVNAFSITIYDMGGIQLTDPYTFNTYGGCDHNVIIINFKQR